MSEEALDLSMTELLMLRKQTGASKLMNEVPRPGTELKVGGLPSWKATPLGVKLPMMSAPPGAILFTRGEIGSKLWIGTKDAEFCLSDPYCREVQYSYNVLHDPHLKRWFKAKKNLKPLIKMGIVNENGMVKCSLEQFNQYRRYLSRLHTDSVTKEQQRREARSKEEKLFRELQRNAMVENTRQIQRDIMKEKLQAMLSEQIAKQKEAEERSLKNIIKAEKIRKKLKKKASEESAIRRLKSKMRDIKILNYMKASIDIQRKKKIVTLKRWAENEKERTAQKQAREKQKKEAHQNKEANRWKAKVQLQEYQMAKEKEMIIQYERYLSKKKKLREMVVKGQRNKFDRELEERKQQNQAHFKNDTKSESDSQSRVTINKSRKGLITVGKETQVTEPKITSRPKPSDQVSTIIKDIINGVITEFVRNKIISELVDLISEDTQNLKSPSLINEEPHLERFQRSECPCLLHTEPASNKKTNDKLVPDSKSIKDEPSNLMSVQSDLSSRNTTSKLFVKSQMEQKIVAVMKKMRRLYVWRSDKLRKSSWLSDTPIIDDIAREKRERRKGIDVVGGLIKLVLSTPIERMAAAKLGPYLDAVVQHVMDPQGYPLALEINELLPARKL